MSYRRQLICLAHELFELSRLASGSSSFCDSVANFRDVAPERMEVLRSDIGAIEERMVIVSGAILEFERAAGIRIHKRIFDAVDKTPKRKRSRRKSGRAA